MISMIVSAAFMLVFLAGFLGLCVGLGFLLRWMLGIDLGVAILIAQVGVVVAFKLFSKIADLEQLDGEDDRPRQLILSVGGRAFPVPGGKRARRRREKSS